MTEDYLHYIWKFSKFNQNDLRTTNGEKVVLVKKGFHNDNAGPDFLEAKIQIDETLWAGSVEIHLKTSQWKQHRHHTDERYNNVVLHVVYQHDGEILNKNKEEIPVLELKNLIDENAYFYYEKFLNAGKDIPCQSQLKEVPSFILNSTLDAMLVERLERKSNDILKLLDTTAGDWEEAFHQYLFRYMGMKINAEQMTQLAVKVPLKIILKESSNLFSLEALLFGQAGMLDKGNDIDYHDELRNEYLYLKQKYGLVPMKGIVWKFSRMRPPNFPTLRIAQIAAIYNATRQLFQMVRTQLTYKDIATVLDLEPSDFWKAHYSFTAEKHQLNAGKLGESSLSSLIINWIVPFAFAYGKSVGNDAYETYASNLLEQLKPEKNAITKRFSEIGFVNQSAKDSQAILQLNNNYCEQKKCLNCKIGVHLLQ